MTVTLTIPDDLTGSIPAEEVPQAVLEAFAVEQYRSEKLTAKQVRLLLGHRSRFETERFLADHNALPSPSAEEVFADAEVAITASQL